MQSPTTSLATLRPDLAASFMEFDLEMDRLGFIANQVLPVMEVALQASPFGRIPLEQLLQNPDTARAPGSGYSRSDFTFITDSYACEENGHESPVDDRQSKMYRHYFDAELIAAMRALDIVLRTAEKRVSSLIFNPTTWNGAGLTTAVTNQWDKFATATPIDDVEAVIKKVWEGSGLWPNALVINRRVFRNLRNCVQVRDRIASSGAGDSTKASKITRQQLAEVFDLPNIIVAGSAKNTAAEGQSAVVAPVWSDEYAMVCKVSQSPDIQEPCIGRTFHWGDDGSEIGGTVEIYRDETTRSDVVRVRHDTADKVLYKEAGHLMSNITT